MLLFAGEGVATAQESSGSDSRTIGRLLDAPSSPFAKATEDRRSRLCTELSGSDASAVGRLRGAPSRSRLCTESSAGMEGTSTEFVAVELMPESSKVRSQKMR